MRGVVKELQNTYDLVEGVQTRSPDYKIQGYLEIVKNEDWRSFKETRKCKW